MLYADDLIWGLVTLVAFGVCAGVYVWFFYEDPAKACAALTDPAEIETKRVVGGIIFFAFLVGAIALVVWMAYRFGWTDAHNANFKYAISMVLWFLPAALIFDNLFEDTSVRPAHLWFTVLAFILVAFLTWLWNRYLFPEIDPVFGDPRSTPEQKQRGVDWYVFLLA